MMLFKLLAATTAAGAAFAPFYATPVQTGLDVTHITVYADTPDEGRAMCRDEMRWEVTAADCRVEPSSQTPNLTKRGWALQFGPDWASKNPDDYEPSTPARSSKPARATNFWGVQDVESDDWVSPW